MFKIIRKKKLSKEEFAVLTNLSNGNSEIFNYGKVLGKDFENYRNAGRIYVTGPEKVLETLKSIYDLLRLVMLKKEKDLTKHYHSLVMEEIDYNARF